MAELYSSDQAFIRKLADIVLNHLHNERFGVRELVLEAGLSRSVLHRRLHAIKNQNVSQFIREIRLKKALELLQQDHLSASEIAYQVGFGSPAYFSKCFHDFSAVPLLRQKGKTFQAYGHFQKRLNHCRLLPKSLKMLFRESEKGLWYFQFWLPFFF
jgi:AraC-like DNA-binding protein